MKVVCIKIYPPPEKEMVMRADTCFKDGHPLKPGWTPKMAKEQMERKTELMRHLAQAVITLSENGDIISTEIVPEFACYGNYLVVIGPVRAHGEYVSQAVRLEIAFSRSVPYEEFRWKEGGEKKVMRRRWYSPLSDEELAKIAPKICEVIQELIDERLKERENLVFKKSIGRFSYRNLVRGAFITIPGEPNLLQYILLAKNRESRNAEFLASFAQQVSHELKGLRSGRYSKKQLEAHPGVRILAPKIKCYTKEQIAWVLERFRGSRARYRNLLELIIDRLNIPLRKRKEWYEKAEEQLRKRYEKKFKTLVGKCALRVATHPKLDAERKTLPKGFVRVEILPSRKLVMKHALRTTPLPPEESIPEYHAEF